MTIASMSSTRSRRYVKSGSTRSMPIISAVGKRSPQSTTTSLPSYSTTLRFLPISPTPPSGSTRMAPLIASRPGESPSGRLLPATRARSASRRRSPRVDLLQQPVASQRGADVLALGVVALHEREPERARVVAEHAQRRLDGRRAGGDEHRRVDLLQRRVELRARLGLLVHPAHLRAGDVRGHADPAGAAHVQAAGVDVVVAGQDREAVDWLQLVAVGLLAGVDPVDLRKLGEQVR